MAREKVAVCTICSREKNPSDRLLPAVDRYIGSHVALVRAQAEQRGQPLYFLSSLYGLIPAGQYIVYYNHLLKPDEVPELKETVAQQLTLYGLEEIHFFTKKKPYWQLYLELFSRLRTRLYVYELPADA